MGCYDEKVFNDRAMELKPLLKTWWQTQTIWDKFIAKHPNSQILMRHAQDVYVLAVTDRDYINVTGKWLGKDKQACRVSLSEVEEEKRGEDLTNCYVFGFVMIDRREQKWNIDDSKNMKLLKVTLIETTVGGHNFGMKILEKVREMAKEEGRKLIIDNPIDKAMRYWCRPKIRMYLDSVMTGNDWEERAKRIANWSEKFISKIKRCKNDRWKIKQEWQRVSDQNPSGWNEMSKEMKWKIMVANCN